MIDRLEPLRRLDGLALDGLRLHLAKLADTDKSGWKAFKICITDTGGDYEPPAVEGIYSVGGRGVSPWMEVLAYHLRLKHGSESLELTMTTAESMLFKALSGTVPPGGHIMLWSEGEDHRDTARELNHGVPPVATRLGMLLFEAGFPRIKFFDVPEGGWEGQQKLWAEKPFRRSEERAWLKMTMEEINQFLQQGQADTRFSEAARRGRRLLEETAERLAH